MAYTGCTVRLVPGAETRADGSISINNKRNRAVPCRLIYSERLSFLCLFASYQNVRDALGGFGKVFVNDMWFPLLYKSDYAILIMSEVLDTAPAMLKT